MSSKLSALLQNKPIKTSIEGIYIKDLPAKVMEKEFGDLVKLLNEEPEEGLAKLFQGLICDAEGNPFEDCQTYEDITSTLSLANIKRIVEAAGRALTGEEDLGN